MRRAADAAAAVAEKYRRQPALFAHYGTLCVCVVTSNLLVGCVCVRALAHTHKHIVLCVCVLFSQRGNCNITHRMRLAY